MSVNRYDSSTGTLTTISSGGRQWIGTQSQYNAQKLAGTLPNDCLIIITDDEDKAAAEQITYDNTESGLAADNMQDAIDEAAENISNTNLIDNPFFTVNSRGLTVYSGNKYNVDRWKCGSVNSNVTINSDNSLTLGKLSTGSCLLMQYIDDNVTEKLVGKTITISINVKNIVGSLIRFRLRYSSDSSETYLDQLVSDYLTVGTTSLTGIVPSGTKKMRLEIYDSTTTDSSASITVESVKLELGTLSTLHLDTIPNYSLELAKSKTATADTSDTYANKGDILAEKDVFIKLKGSKTTTIVSTYQYDTIVIVGQVGGSTVFDIIPMLQSGTIQHLGNANGITVSSITDYSVKVIVPQYYNVYILRSQGTLTLTEET